MSSQGRGHRPPARAPRCGDTRLTNVLHRDEGVRRSGALDVYSAGERPMGDVDLLVREADSAHRAPR